MPGAKVEPFGDSALRVVFPEAISAQASAQVMQAAACIRNAALPYVVDIVPAYCTVLVGYDPLQTSCTLAAEEVRQLLQSPCAQPAAGRTLRIPVAYGGEFGPDLATVARHTGLAEDEVVDMHSAPTYSISMLGFMPGFAYLRGMDSRLETPRLASPRVKVPAGSVGIAAAQTGIYPLESPGGWQIIGCTPLRLFDPARTPSVPYEAGDNLVFQPIDAAAFEAVRRDVAAGTFNYSRLVVS